MARNSSVGRQLIFLEGLWSDQLVQILEHALDMTRSMIVTVRETRRPMFVFIIEQPMFEQLVSLMERRILLGCCLKALFNPECSHARTIKCRDH